MPSVQEMFPSKYLSYRDFAQGQSAVVTIKSVEVERVSAQRGGGWGGQARAEATWLMFFHELPKPLMLKKNKAEKIAMLLGHHNTDHWVGRRLEIYRGVWSNGGESGEGLMISDRPVPQLAAPAANAPSLATNPQFVGKRCPRAGVDRFIASIAEKGQNWDTFLKWLKGKDPAVFGLAYGEDFDRIPASAVPYMKAFLDELHGGAAGEVINTTTGEVVNSLQQARTNYAAAPDASRASVPQAAAQPAPKVYQAPQGYASPLNAPEEISEDDIPF